MLRIDTWEPEAPARTTTRVATLPGSYVRHAGQSVASLRQVLRGACVDQRCVERVTGWAREVGAGTGHPVTEDAYQVLGWTSAAVLRANLSRRLDALNPVAAFRLLDQPEIGRLERSAADYVVLRTRYGFGNEWPAELSGAVSALDVDLWFAVAPAELDGAVALDLESYLRRFAVTEIHR